MQTKPSRWTLLMTLAAALLGPPTAAAARVDHDLAAIADAMVAGIDDLRVLAALATAGDERVAITARTRLRAAGPAGLQAYLALHGETIAAANMSSGTATGARPPVLESLDEICGQRDCAAAQLYWYTDLEQAKQAARASGRPIVSLRLLGDLRDELSCANSRLFRALLYPDPAVAALLRGRFVLHWHSERPAPKITIDLGEGRTIESTITGNSVHYVLDREGRVVDALPGLTTPAAFVTGLERAAGLASATVGLEPAARAMALREHHAARLVELERVWDSELRAIGQRPRPPRRVDAEPTPRAGDVAMLSGSKSSIEVGMLRALGEPVTTLTDAEIFDRLAERHIAEVVLSGPALARLEAQQWRSGDRSRDAAAFAAATTRLREDLARDTVRNELDLHRTIHRWFGGGPLELEALNRRIYDELFLTPRSDPWLGLAAPTIHSGLDGGGRRMRL